MWEIPQRGYDANKVPQKFFQILQYYFGWLGIFADTLVKKNFTEESRLKDEAGESFEHLSFQDRRHLFVG